jgi:hypothetical protein
MTHDTTDVALVAQLDNGLEVLIEDDRSIVIFGPDEVKDGYEGNPWADDGAHLRHINVDTMNLTPNEARDIASALIEAADHLDDLGQVTRRIARLGDDRTPEQHAADIAAATLERLAKLGNEFATLETQLQALYVWADGRQQDGPGRFLEDIADAVGKLTCCVPEAVRDIAATLPIRGLDYGTNDQ